MAWDSTWAREVLECVCVFVWGVLLGVLGLAHSLLQQAPLAAGLCHPTLKLQQGFLHQDVF